MSYLPRTTELTTTKCKPIQVIHYVIDNKAANTSNANTADSDKRESLYVTHKNNDLAVYSNRTIWIIGNISASNVITSYSRKVKPAHLHPSTKRHPKRVTIEYGSATLP